MTDGWEVSFGLDSGDPADGNEDSDSDGFSNRQEADRGTDPTSYVISLRKGWNLVALAGIPDDNSLQNIFGANIWSARLGVDRRAAGGGNRNPAGGKDTGFMRRRL